NFTTWFKNTFIIDHNESVVIIGVPNAFTKAWLEKKYTKEILQALANITSVNQYSITYQVATPTEAPRQGPTHKERSSVGPLNHSQAEESSSKPGLNTRYLFENFIVGPGNQLANAAARAVVDKPGEVYNPLFIYGGVGLGKTHLMQAIGNHLSASDSKLKVLYVNSEKFTNDFVNAIKQGNTERFKKTYRSVDVLLIDDIQFIAGKEQTQEEFFHTFNTLHQSNKQIVISSDRPPKAIAAIENRLVSRFEWGMIADISAPDFETRVAILQTKCQEKGISLDDDIIRSIAETVRENIRELEGALNRIVAYHQLSNSAPTKESAKSLLITTSAKPSRGGITCKRLMEMVSEFFDISLKDLAGASRKKELVIPRQITMYLLREELSFSYPHIGQQLGGRDHTTAMHACTKIEEYLSKNEKIRNDVALLRQKIYE
ncbi:MAG: chromosomal replication initiator protein DnaA, partial [Patescibacteria group bacterium]